MFILRSTTWTVVLVLMNMFLIGAVGIGIEFKTVYLQHNTSLLVDRDSYSSPGMVFGTCSQASKVKSRLCTLVLETTRPVDSPDHFRACNITVKSKERYEEIRHIDKVVAFSDDKAILVWNNQDLSIKFTILHFANCRTYNSKIDNGVDIKYGRIVAVADDMFDVIERYDTNSSCKRSEFCKLTLDDQGNVITGLSAWGSRKLDDSLIDVVHSPLMGRLIVDANSWMSRVRVLVEYKFRVLTKFYNDYKTRLLLRTPSVSKTHQRLTVCYEYNFSMFHCAHFDWNGNLKFGVTLYIYAHTSLESIVTVHNIPGGGFLFIHGAINHDNYFCKNCFTVTKVDARGYEVGYKDFVFLFPYKYRFDFREVHFRVDQNGKYCLSHPFQSDKNGGFEVTLTVACFDDNDLKSTIV